MNFSTTTLLVAFFSFGSLHAVYPDPIVYEGQTMNIIVPECPLAPGSMQLLPKSDLPNFVDWQDIHKLEAYHLIQRIVKVWEKRGIHDYLIFAKETPDSLKFRWEIVPFSKDGFRFWKQFNVLWNIIFGSSCLSEQDQVKIIENFQAENDLFSDTPVQQLGSLEVIGKDPFCQQKIIDRQIVLEGKEINVLYNYAPVVLGEDKLHFLIVPKQHRPGFSDLTETEYLEAMDLVQHLVDFYTTKGYEIVYIFDKTGVEAGQTVPHWHEHVIFAASKTQEFVAKLMVLKNMLFSSSTMGEEELKIKVKSLRNELREMPKEN